MTYVLQVVPTDSGISAALRIESIRFFAGHRGFSTTAEAEKWAAFVARQAARYAEKQGLA